MIKKFAQLVLVGAFFSAGVAQAADMNIVVLNSARAVFDSDEAKLLAEAANKEMEAEQSEIREMAEAMQALQTKLQTDGEVMSASEKRSVSKDIEDMQIDLQFRTQKLQKQVQDKQQEIFSTLAPKLDKVLQDIIQVDQIDIVMKPESMWYWNPKHDITRRVTEKLNEQRD